MSKFKVGDRVIRARSNPWNQELIGHTAIVEDVRLYGEVKIRWDVIPPGYPPTFLSNPDRLELYFADNEIDFDVD